MPSHTTRTEATIRHTYQFFRTAYTENDECLDKVMIYDYNGITQKNPIRYRGYYYDRGTGLYYLNARYYNPQWQRFISPDSSDYLDPETPNGLNLYAYCYNDPVNYADPSGNSASLILGLVGLGLGIGLGLGYATYVDSRDDNEVNGSIGLGFYLYSAGTFGSLGFLGGYLYGPQILAFISSLLGSSGTVGALALAGGEVIETAIAGSLIVGGVIAAELGIILLYERKKAAPRIKSNTKKQAYDKAFYKGGKKPPIYHPNGTYGPHFHPANLKFKHWHYYFSFILGILGFDLDDFE